MPEITTKAAVKEIPRTTVDEAIRRGRRKVQESRSLREKQEAARPVHQSTVPTAGMEQGDMLDPFNFTTALRMMDERDVKEEKDLHEAMETRGSAKGPQKPERSGDQPGGKPEKAQSSHSKEVEGRSQGEKEVRTDEQGAVVEEKETAEPSRKAAGREVSAKRTVRMIMGNAPVQVAVLAQENENDPNYRTAHAGTGGRVFANMRMTEMLPKELRLNAGLREGSAKNAVREEKDNQDERGGERAEGPVRKETSRSALQAALDTAYKSHEYRTTEENSRAERERGAAGKAVAQHSREIPGIGAEAAPAEGISRVVSERQPRKEEEAKVPRIKDREETAGAPFKEASSGKDAMDSIITGARENAEAGNLVMQAATITHATGRELQFEKGIDILQIRKEGNETFAYINGEKADIGKARDFMKELSKGLGSELSGQLQSMVKTLSQSPALSMQQAAGIEKRPELQLQIRDTDAITRD